MFNFLKRYDGKQTDNRVQTPINSAEYEKLAKRLVELHTEMQTLQTEHETIKTSLANLRGNFNRKLGALKADEQESNSEQVKRESETIKSDEIVGIG